MYDFMSKIYIIIILRIPIIQVYFFYNNTHLLIFGDLDLVHDVFYRTHQ